MQSDLPKVLHLCAELPLVSHVVRLAIAKKCDPIVVVINPQGTRVRELLTASFPDAPLRFAVQAKPQGTGDAARAGLSAIPDFRGRVLVLYGDVPLLTTDTVGRLEKASKRAKVAFLTAEVPDPSGYGRVVRDPKGRALAVVEHKDATPEQRRIREVNAGVYLCDSALLRQAVGGLKKSNAQGEFYLTDVVSMAASEGGAAAVLVDAPDDIRGVNSRAELAEAEAILRRRLIAAHQARGVTFRDPANTFVGLDVRLGKDVTIGVGVQLWGDTQVKDGAVIEGPTVIKDAVIGPS